MEGKNKTSNGILYTHQKINNVRTLWSDMEQCLKYTLKKQGKDHCLKYVFTYICIISKNAYKESIMVEGSECADAKMNGGFLDTMCFLKPCMIYTICMYCLYKNTFKNF